MVVPRTKNGIKGWPAISKKFFQILSYGLPIMLKNLDAKKMQHEKNFIGW